MSCRRAPSAARNKLDKGVLGDIKFDNDIARAVKRALPLVLPLCHEHLAPDDAQRWRRALALFDEFMHMLCARHHFTRTKVLAVQEKIDDFFDVWKKQTSEDGYGNYMHSLDAGHVCDNLEEVGNLYRLSQQGWEVVNKKVKNVFFNQTAMGGRRRGSTSKLLPIIYLFLREMYWKFGWADDYFKNHVYPRAEGEEYAKLDIKEGYQRPTHLTEAQVESLAKALVEFDPDVDGFNDNVMFAEVLEGMSEEEEQRIIDAFCHNNSP